MRAFAFAVVLAFPLHLLAQTTAGKSVREVALNVAVTMTGHEMRTCSKAHPAHATHFTRSLDSVQKRLEAALDGLRPHRTADLDLVVPEAIIVGQEMMLALQASDTSLRTLEACNRTASEIANVTEREATGLMNQMVTTIVSGIGAHKSEMQRVLR